jgi:hypothetical protein
MNLVLINFDFKTNEMMNDESDVADDRKLITSTIVTSLASSLKHKHTHTANHIHVFN